MLIAMSSGPTARETGSWSAHLPVAWFQMSLNHHCSGRTLRSPLVVSVYIYVSSRSVAMHHELIPVLSPSNAVGCEGP